MSCPLRRATPALGVPSQLFHVAPWSTTRKVLERLTLASYKELAVPHKLINRYVPRGDPMKFAPLAPLTVALLLAACSNNDRADSHVKGGSSTPANAAAADAETDTNFDAKPTIDPDTPASQFAVLDDATDCLGISWHYSDDEGKDRVRVQFAQLIDGDKMKRTTDVFAKKDYVASLESVIESRVAPYGGKRLYSLTTEVGDDPYREYNFEKQSFFDSSKLTWGGGGRVYSQHEGRGGQPGVCVVQFTNGKMWDSEFIVRDEGEARAASAALAARNSAVKVYFHVDTIGTSQSIAEWPQVNARIVRIELVDADGIMLARGLPKLSEDEAAAAENNQDDCHINPLNCF